MSDRSGHHANQAGGYACVRTGPQGEMSSIAACHIDPMWLRKALRVPVGRNDPQDDSLALSNEEAIEIKVRRSRPEESACQAGVAQKFLDCLLRQFGLLMQQAPFLRVLHQRK